MQTLLEASAGHGASRYERFVALVSEPRAALGIALLAMVLTLPALAIGLTGDDFDAALSVTRDPLSGYVSTSSDREVRHAQLLARRTAGDLPWWADLDFHLALMRPLASLSLALDFALWPSAPWLMHLENSLLFALTVLVAASLYGAFGFSPRARGLATVCYAFQPGPAMSIGWISGRNTVLATLFGLLALRLAIAAHGDRAWRACIGSWLCFALALASGEFGVSSLAYVAAFALFMGRTSAAPRLQLLSGFAAVLIAWIVVYKLGGYGSEHSGFYVDASRDPAAYFLQLLTSIPMYLASVLTFPLASLSVISTAATLVLVCAALASLFVSRRLWLPWLHKDVRARTLGAGALLAIVPLASSPAQDRLVSFVALGVCGLVALIVEERLGAAQVQPQKGALRLLRYRVLWAPVLFFPFLFGSNGTAAGGGGKALDAVIGDDPRHVLLLNAPSDLPAHFVASKRRWLREPKPPIDVLYAGGSDAVLTRKSEQTLELSVPSGYFQGRIEQIGRDPSRSPFHVGEVISAARMRTQILEVKDGAPTRVRFDFTDPLSQTHVLTWQGRSIVAISLPNIGESTQINRASAI